MQYHHYIPRFILKQFAFTDFVNRKQENQDFLKISVPCADKDFYLGEVSNICGAKNLYYNAGLPDPMRIEHLFSKLESKTSCIFRKISEAVTSSKDHIVILEKDVHTLFKFMMLSSRRSQKYRDDIKDPYRENDFMFQRLFELARKQGRSGEPGQFWLEHLLYLLETEHENLLVDAKNRGVAPAAETYKHFVEDYALQIWKAADGYEFFLNERLVDFEGDTQSLLGVEVTDTGPQLTWTTTEDFIHLILPITPQVAVVFCNEARCWDSPLSDEMRRQTKLYPENTLLKDAPHKDIVESHIPSTRRGKKTWPATKAWRVNIGTLAQSQHRIIASYSLSHAESFVIFQHRGRFERAKRELEVFSKERCEVWKSQGLRFGEQKSRPKEKQENGPTKEQRSRLVDEHMIALTEIERTIKTKNEPLPKNKENAVKSWLGIRAVETYRLSPRSGDTSRAALDAEPTYPRIMHPALKAAFEAAYPPQHPSHRRLITIDFGQFLSYGVGEETFAQLTSKIESKISELVCKDSFHAHWEAAIGKEQSPEELPIQKSETRGGDSVHHTDEDVTEDLSFRSIYRMAGIFDALKWMFEERQDILATFIQQMCVPSESLQPRIFRMRSVRK